MGVVGALPHHASTFGTTWRRRWPLVLAAAGVVATLLSLTLEQRRSEHALVADLPWSLAWLSYLAVGGLVVHRRPDLPVGRILVAAGFAVALGDLLSTLSSSAARDGLSAAALLGWVAGLLFVPAAGLVGIALPLALPLGTLPAQGRRRTLLSCGLVAWLVWFAAYAVSSGRLDANGRPNPFGVPGADLVAPVAGAVVALAAAAAVVSLVARWRGSLGAERRALAYLALGAVAQITLFGLATLAQAAGVAGPGWLTGAGVVLVISALPVAVGLAILRTGLLDIELVLRRTLTYLAMTVVVVAVYSVTVLVVGRLTSHTDGLSTSLLVIALAAVGLSPLRERAQRQVDRMLYGRRADPYGVLRDLDTAVARARTPAEVLAVVTEVVARSLRLPYVAVELVAQGGPPARRTSWGREQRVERELELTHHGRQVGTLLLAPRSPGERFSVADDRVLREVADHAASAVAAVGLAEEAQLSRERLVKALEEDRRRIRRDLHDHLGPVLSGITLQLDALRRLSGDNDEAVALNDTIRGEVAEAVVDVRRLVHDLRPPVLDQLGLVEAMRHHADVVSQQLDVQVVADAVPPLPAAVEVAVYRIATEALTNTLRHAGASRAVVSLEVVAGRLVLVVSDDGAGMAAGTELGVGLTSMRERVAELGGTLAISSLDGTTIRVELPT